MLDFLFASENMPFTVALIVMVLIGLLEGVTTLLGFGASSLLDSLLPEADLDVDLDLDADAGAIEASDGFDLGEVGHPSALSRVLGWLHIGRVPILILFLVFLTAFGFAGLVLQQIADAFTGRLAPALLVSVPALVVAVFLVRTIGGLLARIIPKDETAAVSETTFVGRIAVVTLGAARRGQPAQAKLRDQHGQTHYVMVEPDNDADTLTSGEHVLLVSRHGHLFHAIPNPNEALTD